VCFLDGIFGFDCGVFGYVVVVVVVVVVVIADDISIDGRQEILLQKPKYIVIIVPKAMLTRLGRSLLFGRSVSVANQPSHSRRRIDERDFQLGVFIPSIGLGERVGGGESPPSRSDDDYFPSCRWIGGAATAGIVR